MTYLETVKNKYNLPSGSHEGEWIKDVVRVKDVSVRLKNSTSKSIPVTLKVQGKLIDVYTGGRKCT
jgi:hypothetical protein